MRYCIFLKIEDSLKIFAFSFILNQIHMQCTEKVERASSETKSEAVDIKSPGKNDDEGISADWSRSSPSKKVGEGPELSSDALHDMAAVLDRSAGAGDSSLLEVVNDE